MSERDHHVTEQREPLLENNCESSSYGNGNGEEESAEGIVEEEMDIMMGGTEEIGWVDWVWTWFRR